jgi:hypothetical protein
MPVCCVTTAHFVQTSAFILSSQPLSFAKINTYLESQDLGDFNRPTRYSHSPALRLDSAVTLGA